MLPADNRIKLAFLRFLGNVYGKLFQSLKIIFGTFAVGNPALAVFVNHLIKFNGIYAGSC